MPKFLVIGQNYTPLVKKIQARGDEYLLLQDKAMQFSSNIDEDRCQWVDFKDINQIINGLKPLKSNLDGAVALYEQYVLPLAKIAVAEGLEALDIRAAEACTNKLLMRQRLATSPEPISPAYCEVGSEAGLLKFASSYGFPLILKPVHLSKSLLITKCHSEKELLDSYRQIKARLEQTYKKYAPAQRPKLIVEQFMEGPQFSVDAFVDSAGKVHIIDNLTVLQTGFDIGYNDNFTYSREFKDVDPELKKQMFHASKLGIKALRIKSAPAFVQLVLTNEGPRIIEIAARLGGYRERMYRLSRGIDMLNNLLQIALGLPVDIKASKHEPCAVLELFPRRGGTFKAIKNEAALRNLESLEYLSIKAKVGSNVGKSSEGYKMSAIVILHNNDQARFNQDLNFVNKEVLVQTA